MLCVIGKSASGKTTLIEELKKRGYKKAVTYTTRPMRPGEIDGIDYHFLSVKDFKSNIEKGFFAEFYDFTREGKTDWLYGSSKESYLKSDEKTFVILTPNGIRDVKKNGVPLTVFYLVVPDHDRKRALLKRGDDSIEIERRIIRDNIDFEEAAELSDFVISNPHYFLTPEELADKTIGLIGKKNE